MRPEICFSAKSRLVKEWDVSDILPLHCEHSQSTWDNLGQKKVLRLLQLEIEEYEAITSNRCSLLACTYVTKGTHFLLFTSWLFLSLLYFMCHKDAQWGNGFIELHVRLAFLYNSGHPHYRFPRRLSAFKQFKQVSSSCRIQLFPNDCLFKKLHECTVFLQYDFCIRNVIITIFRYIVQSYQGCSCIIE